MDVSQAQVIDMPRELREAIAIVLPCRDGAGIAARMIRQVYPESRIGDVIRTIDDIRSQSWTRTSQDIEDLWRELEGVKHGG